MADVTVNIPAPVLAFGEKFKVRYRNLPSGSFTAYTDYTTNTFTLFGLSTGSYELEAIFVPSDDVECEAVYHYFDVYADYECLDFSSMMIENPANSGIYFIQVNFQIGTAPPCGWEITLTPLAGGATRTLTYPTLPSTGVIRIAAPNVDTYLTATALLCNGREKECYTVIVSKITPIEPCVPIVIVSSSLDYLAGNRYGIDIIFTQSNPPMKGANVVWQQTGTPITAGTPLDKGSYIVPGRVFQAVGSNFRLFISGLNPVPTFGQYTYIVKLTDECGIEHVFTIMGG